MVINVKFMIFYMIHYSLLPVVCMVGITYVYIDTIFVFYGYTFLFTALLYVSVCLSGHMIFLVS